MTKPFTYSLIFWLTVLLMTAIVSCDQPADKNTDQSINNNEIKDASHLDTLSNDEEKIARVDSIENKTINNFDGDRYIVDCEESRIEWFCGKHTGYVKLKSGTFYLKEKEIVGGNFFVLIDSIVNTDIDYELMRLTLMNTLKSKDFFDAEQFPTSRFKLTRIEKIDGDNHCLSGLLKIKDVERLITFHSEIKFEDEFISAISEKFIIDRTKWGITTMSQDYVESEESFIVTDEIRLVVHLVARAQ
jgi:polyisoprenoid-binding protein YceI